MCDGARSGPLPASGESSFAPLLPPATTLRILSDGRAGHEAQTLGIAEALGLTPDIRRVAPRKFYDWIAPFGPPDPQDAPAFAPPYPDIAIAAGRRTIPALRRLKRDSGGATFTVYVNRPATGPGTADLIVAPRHDRLSAPNVISALTPANRVTPERLARARAAPDPRIAALPRPRAAMLIGSAEGVVYDLDFIASYLLAAGESVMATPSRRTPPEISRMLCGALSAPGGYFWGGEGENPYLSMLANADRIIVTGDSVNMVGEAVATGAPVHVIEPFVTRRKLRAYLAALEKAGAIRIWSGPFDDWTYKPINSTPTIARGVAEAFRRFAA
ncbi:mitochondrial fission ELM1 family protein [Methylocystis sp. WRRC1]|uniref:mitochondrial fission ELM1 family protein n=1 Tax=Methylocystis sp. WRRC1 TaxID=1732014 RepID=UPI001D142952|nr:mitochondrial fission ELM1 family protein [Methylocystis sp. WRRC1]MCC3244376.1 mitochondrial fission ELM1 family protein [Methylocystis sp. WRRC1]